MARPLRLEFPGALYHLTARGNARQAIFLDDEDRTSFLHWLGGEVTQQSWICHAYCLMQDHYHIVIETPEANLVRGMRRLNGVYTQAFNRRHGLAGHVFQGRYKSVVVEKDHYLLELCRHVVLNPKRANLVKKIEEWPWSSYRATAGYRSTPEWLTTDWILRQFAKDRHEARLAYRRFVRKGVHAASPWESLRGQIWLGSDAFLQRMQQLVEGQLLEGVPAVQANPARPTTAQILRAASQAYGLRRAQLLKRHDESAFRAVVYLLRRVANLSLKEVAGLVNLSPGRISQIQKQIEQSGTDTRLRTLLESYDRKV